MGAGIYYSLYVTLKFHLSLD